MARLFRRLFRTVKRRIKKGMRDQRTFNLHLAAHRLLADHDHEQISVAQLSREAGISVGAFYQRFPNKDAFLGRVVVERLYGARRDMERALAPERWRRSSAAAVTRAIIEEMIRNLHGPGAGVVRVALKRAHLDRQKLEPLVVYRTALADSAVALLVHRVSGVRHPERAIRSTVQIATATALDALLYEAGTLRPGSWRMADALSGMMLSMLGLAAGRRIDGKKKNNEKASPDDDDDDKMLAMPIEEVVAESVPELPPSHRRERPEKRTGDPVEIIDPKTVSLMLDGSSEEKKSPEPQRRRHRPKF
jgi:AcrR family transcriptional regulator